MRLKIEANIFATLLLPALSLAMLASVTYANAAEPFKIGGTICRTGPFAENGIDQERGAKLAVKAINEAGGIDGHKLEIIVEDDQGRPDIAVTRATKLAVQDKVSAIIGCYATSVLAYADMIKKSEIPIFGMASSTGLTATGNPYVFRTVLADPILIKGLTDILRKHGKKKVAILYQGDAYGKGAVSTIKADAVGIDVVAEESFPVQANLDLTPQLTRIRSKEPDAVVIWSGTAQGIVALKNMQQLGMKVSTYGAPPLTSSSVIPNAGDAAEGLMVSNVLVPGTLDDDQARFYETFKKEYGAYPSTFFGMVGWDTIHIIAEALKGTEGEGFKVKANTEKLSDYRGMSGTFSFSSTNHEGLTADSIKWYVVDGGKFTSLKQ